MIHQIPNMCAYALYPHPRVRDLDTVRLKVHEFPRDLLGPRLGHVARRTRVKDGRMKCREKKCLDVLSANKRW